MPDVSIILPAWNAAETIERSVESMRHQTFSDFELLVIDDGSIDDTADRIALIAQEDSRVRLFRRPHAGVAATANFGFQQASAPLVARMDADDVSAPQRLQRQVEWLKQHNLDAVGCQVRILNYRDEPVHGMQRYQRWINEETLSSSNIAALRFVEFPLANPTILARRSYFESNFANNEFPEDYDLFLRAANAGLRFGKVPETLFSWYDSNQRLTRTDARYTDDAFMACRRHHMLAGPLAQTKSVCLWGGGQTGKDWLRWFKAQGFEVRFCVDVHPRRIGKLIHNTPFVGPEDLPAADEQAASSPLVIAVGTDGSRKEIQDFIEAKDYTPGIDAWFVA